MAVQSAPGARFIPDFTEDDFLQSIECFVNGAWYPRHEVQLSRISRVSVNDTGVHGELVSAVPFFLSYRTASFVPPLSQSRIREERSAAGISEDEAYCFTAVTDPDTLECTAHNALFLLSGIAPAGYAIPLFYRRRALSMLKQRGRGEHVHGDDEESEKGRTLYFNSGLLRESAVITPDTRIEKAESRIYISYDRKGSAAVHRGGEAQRIRQERFAMSSFIENIVSSSFQDRDLGDYADELLAMMPDLFGQTAGSRKLKCIMENALYECIDERELPANASVQKGLDHLGVREKLVITEKLLRTHLGIVQYFRLKYRN